MVQTRSKEYVGRVKELGMNSAAITDHGVMYGVIDFYRAAKAAGIKTDPRMRGLCGAQLPVLTENWPGGRPILSSGSVGGE